jgi:hypothetical protein
MKYTDLVCGPILTLSVALALPGTARAAEPPAAPKAVCTCATVFDQVSKSVEADYAGFQIKVDAERREAYDRVKALLKTDAAGAGPDRCIEVLELYAAFFQDHHLFVTRSKAPGPERTATARPWTEAEARAEIDRHRERLDPVEGLWYSGKGRYAVLHEAGSPAGAFVAVRLKGDGTPSSEIVALLRRTAPGSYLITTRDIQGQWQTGEAALHRKGALLVFGVQGWGRLHPAVPESRLDPADPLAPLFTRLNESTLYLSLPSFWSDYRKPLADLVAARGAEIGKAGGLIIDLRGNGGGDGIYFGLIPYLFTGPFQYREDNMILASPRNLEWVEALRKRQGEQGAVFDPAIRRMRENPGKLVPYLDADSYTPTDLSPGPRRVVLLVDRGVGSAAEGMVLLAEQSPRVIVVGENTRGNIDYEMVTMDSVGCGDQGYYLGLPLYARSRQLPAGALDVIGITPDVPVPDSLADPLAFAVRLLAGG